MPNSSSVRSAPVHYGAVDYVTFHVTMDGAIRAASGPGLESIGSSPTEMAGRSVHDLYEANPDLAAAYAQLFQGRPVTTIMHFMGRMWMFDASPIMDGGNQVGISGAAWLLDERDATERSAPHGQVFTVDGVLYEVRRVTPPPPPLAAPFLRLL